MSDLGAEIAHHYAQKLGIRETVIGYDYIYDQFSVRLFIFTRTRDGSRAEYGITLEFEELRLFAGHPGKIVVRVE